MLTGKLKNGNKIVLGIIITAFIAALIFVFFPSNKKKGIEFFYNSSYSRESGCDSKTIPCGLRNDIIAVKNFNYTIEDFKYVIDYVQKYIDTINIKKYAQFSIQLSTYGNYEGYKTHVLGEITSYNWAKDYTDNGVILFFVFQNGEFGLSKKNKRAVFVDYYNENGERILIDFGQLLKK